MIFTPEMLVYFGASVIVLILLVWLLILEHRLRRLTAGKKGQNLEETIFQLINQVKNTDQVNTAIREHLLKMEERLRHSIQHVKTLRFNPFQGEGQGGNQSFAVAFLDEHGDGVVISSLYTRDNVSVYAKPIKRKQSEFELTEEENAALLWNPPL